MANTLAGLVVKVGLDAAEFTAGLTKSEYQAKKFADGLKDIGAQAGKFLGIVAGIGSVAAFTSMISSSIEAKARLRDLSIQTNINVEALAGLAKVGKFSNTSIDDIATASARLSKAMFVQNEESKGAAQAIGALGLNFDKFKSLSPDQQMLSVAKALEGFADGAEKSAVAMILFGKQGAQLLPFLKELAERGILVTKETAAGALEAKKYEDNLKTLTAAGEEWKKTLVNAILPGLVEVTRELIEGRKAYGGYLAAIFDIGINVDPFASQGENITKTRDKLAELRSELGRVIELEKGPAIGSLSERLQARDKGKIQSEINTLQNRYKYLLGVQAGQALDLGAGVADDPRIAARKPRLPGIDVDKDKDARALLKKQFEGELKLIRDFAEQQKSGYEFANQYVKGVYDDGVVSLSEFFDKQKSVRSAGLQAEIDSYDKEIAAAKAYKAAADKPQDRQDAENKIKEAVEKRALAIQKAGQTNILAAQEESKAIKQLAFNYYDFLSAVREAQGDTVGAAAIGIAKAWQANQELLTKVGFDPAEASKQSGALADRLLIQVQLNKAQADYGLLTESVGAQEKSLLIDAQLSGASEIETLTKIGVLRQDALGALGQLVVKAREFADALGTPEARLFADKLALQFKQAAAEAEPLFARLRDVGKQAGEAIAGGLADAIVQGKGLRETLASIEKQLLSIVLNEQFTKPLGMFLSNAIGGNGTSSGGGGFLGNIFGGIVGALFGGGGSGVTTGDFARLDRRAAGGPVSAGGMYRVNERGPEMLDVNGQQFLMMGSQRGTVTPNDRIGSGGGQTVIFNIALQPGTPRETGLQIATIANQRLAAGRRGM